jgi:hypothetical protein
VRRATAVSAILAALLGASGCGHAVEEVPGLTPAECPGAPEGLTFAAPWPAWDGLVTIGFTVAPDTGTGFDFELWAPGFGYERYSYGDPYLRQHQDPSGAYQIPLAPYLAQLGEQRTDLPTRLRVRSTLWGCPSSAWAETPPFTLGDPFTGTTWVLSEMPSEMHATVHVGGVPGKPTYAFAPGTLVEHRLTFGAGGESKETISFSLSASDPTAPYAGCSFSLHYAGKWRWSMNTNAIEMYLTNRVPDQDPTQGSTCASPALDTLAIVTTPKSAKLTDAQLYLQIDRRPLLANPPAKPSYRDSTALDDACTGISNGLVSGTTLYPSVSLIAEASYVEQ